MGDDKQKCVAAQELTLHTELSSNTLTTFTLLQHQTTPHCSVAHVASLLYVRRISKSKWHPVSAIAKDDTLHRFGHLLFGDNIFTDGTSGVF